MSKWVKTDNIMNFLFIKGNTMWLVYVLSCVRCFHDNATWAIKKDALYFKQFRLITCRVGSLLYQVTLVRKRSTRPFSRNLEPAKRLEVACVAGSGLSRPIRKFRGDTRQKPNWSLLCKLDLKYCILCISWHLLFCLVFMLKSCRIRDSTLGSNKKNCNTCVTLSLHLLLSLLTLSFSWCLIKKPFFLQASFNWRLC